MAKGPKGFSYNDRLGLKKKLCIECKKSWALYGYKKTSVSDLTEKIGISTGAFYLLYSAKEDLFCETLEMVQKNLKHSLFEIVTKDGGKKGFIEAMKWHYQEYDRAPFLYDTSTPDFLAFLNKLPKQRIDNLQLDSIYFFYDIIDLAKLKPKMPKEKIYGIVCSLLYTVTLKDKVKYDKFEVFEFLLENIIDNLFE